MYQDYVTSKQKKRLLYSSREKVYIIHTLRENDGPLLLVMSVCEGLLLTPLPVTL